MSKLTGSQLQNFSDIVNTSVMDVRHFTVYRSHAKVRGWSSAGVAYTYISRIEVKRSRQRMWSETGSEYCASAYLCSMNRAQHRYASTDQHAMAMLHVEHHRAAGCWVT